MLISKWKVATDTSVMQVSQWFYLRHSGQMSESCTALVQVGGVCERVERNAICLFDGAAADPELGCDFLVGIFCNAAQDEHESTKYVQTSMDLGRVVDQPKKFPD
jgi:hypothetical protein